MSFTTRCPACGTMFKVVADQLKISEGWVRCGHCAEVFDATLYLQPWDPRETTEPADAVEPPLGHEAVEPAVAQEDEVMSDVPEAVSVALVDEEGANEPEAAPESPPQVPDADGDALAEPSDESEWDMMQVEQHSLETLPPPDLLDPPPIEEEEAQESDFQKELERFAAGLGRLNVTRSGAILSDAASVDMAGIPSAPAPDDIEARDLDVDAPSEPDESVHELGFVRQARRQAFWQSTGMRVGMSLLALLLALLLAAQWLVHERDRLAAWRPAWQPLLSQVCEHLGCALAPVRRIDAIVIDSSALVRMLGNLYSFDFVLKNTADMPLAVPALELSLTDGSGVVISRRVFLPEEWPGTPTLLPASGNTSVNFRLSLALGDASPMAGYHAVLFYP